MKKLFLLVALALVVMSCEQAQDFIDTKGHGLVFLEGEMKAYFPDKGDTKNYKFNADLAWSAEASADWVEVNPTSGPAGENKIQIKVDKNKSEERRTGYVDITLSNEQSYRIELEQLAAGESLDDIIDPATSIPNNEIWYTTTDGEVLTLNEGAVFNVEIVSNTYINGKGVIKFSGDVTEIGDESFANCTTLSSISIPASIATMGSGAFYGCENIHAVYIFDLAAWCIVDFVLPDLTSNPLCYGANFYLKGELVTNLVIPGGITEIRNNTFNGCQSVTNLTIPNSITTIGDAAFCDCSSLTSVTIPDSVTTIGGSAFAFCSSLTSVTIPDGVTTIGEGAFYECISLTSVTIPDSVTIIRYATFAFCSSLTSVSIPDSVTSIGDCAFYECTSLTSVTIPDSVTTIGEYAFCGCASLSSIVIGANVQAIGLCAFASCFSLTEIYCKSTTPPAVVSWMFEHNSGLVIYVPTESVEAYKSAEYWSGYANAIVGYDF